MFVASRHLVTLCMTVLVSLASTALAQETDAPAYIRAVSTEAQQIIPLLTVGDAVNGYRLVGIPDGMGAFQTGPGTFRLFVNHELTQIQGIVRAHAAPVRSSASGRSPSAVRPPRPN